MEQLVKYDTPGHGCDYVKVFATATDLKIEFGYHGDGESCVGAVEFYSIVAYRYVNEGHFAGLDSRTYQALVEVFDSPWIVGLKEPKVWPWALRHFGTYFRENGYLEVIAADYKYSVVKAT